MYQNLAFITVKRDDLDLARLSRYRGIVHNLLNERMQTICTFPFVENSIYYR